MTPRNLVFCCDGTANEDGTVNTNVVHLYQRLADDPGAQISCYEPGVGTFSPLGIMDGGKVGMALGKLFGHGLTENIENGYRFLMRHYHEGDRVFLFGFSRGAYAVRALSGMLAKVGLLYAEQDNLVRYATRLYNRKGNDEEASGFARTYGRPCPVHLIGVWDTVASLGYLYRNRRFFNAKLSREVTHGYHALAIDERRPKFGHLPWDEARVEPHQTVEQVWFPGAHADVGGGYKERGLAEISLQWLTERARAAGLRLREDVEPPQPPDPAGTLHEPWNTWTGWALKIAYLGEQPREISEGALVHGSVAARREATGYRPEVLPEEYRLVGWGQ
ncbi:hypothetical protein AN478_12040 [Thiohalorhabdus denitrificans]|uniref:Uncharacterized alpha/beta hydrolase domain n=1 Tax=Thiohalorhabdus denitrificans TaxID=381306 RepID=A0A0P9E9J4_9GAMM|nr:DUF2235 domain-containing protein [Thiohalorhabdus denitrificans]KPV39044.1 hypothetical protein AN478_12040 [Thiohalorhabdus denitrificans]SCX79109.1 Uncharacterized alpha/beta hydrolase domain [Thiohalorhabdus denitrificans]